MQATPSLPDPPKSDKPKIFFRIILRYTTVTANIERRNESQNLVIEAHDAKEAAVLAIAKIGNEWVANLQLSAGISHTAEGAE